MKSFYQGEVLGFGTEIPQYNLLADVFRKHVSSSNQKILVFLDSAGGVGYLEFLKLMEYVDDLKCADRIVLVLDDVTHVKHYRSVIWLNQNGYKPHVSKDGRFAHCILSDR